MRLSKLQKYILTTTYLGKQKACNKKEFYLFYPEKERKENLIKIQVAIQQSLENLTNKDLVLTYGHKTAQKWFIQKVRLTSAGRQVAHKLLQAKQQRLKLK